MMLSRHGQNQAENALQGAGPRKRKPRKKMAERVAAEWRDPRPRLTTRSHPGSEHRTITGVSDPGAPTVRRSAPKADPSQTASAGRPGRVSRIVVRGNPGFYESGPPRQLVSIPNPSDFGAHWSAPAFVSRSRTMIRTCHASIRASCPGAQRGGLPRAHQVNSVRLAQSKQRTLGASLNPSSTSSRRLGHILASLAFAG